MSEALEVLDHIDPSQLDYEQWLQVGMALKHEGLTAADWDKWSQRDAARYGKGECFRKWTSFRGHGTPITIASMVTLAKEQGYTPTGGGEYFAGPDEAYSWDGLIGGKGSEPSGRIIDTNYLQDRDVPKPGENWNPVKDLTTYLSTLFEFDDMVGYVTDSWLDESSGRNLPKRGNWDRTAGQLIELLGKCNGDIAAVFGDTNPEVGAWIRFNPLDGEGVFDENVTEFRYALIESDELSIQRQYTLMTELELPIAAMVHSGGKSLHAIVRVDADDYQDYRKKVDFLWETVQRNGLKLDRQNRNPSRLSRMPGIVRNGEKQYLVGVNLGKKSWDEWKEWVEDLKDDLPDISELVLGSDEPELAPELIEGVLREGHKLLIAGPSKAGKSFALMQFCIALSEGETWFSWNIKQGRVLYVNLELDPRSSKHRFWTIYKGMGLKQTPGGIDTWELRGSATSLDKLAPKLIRRAQKKGYTAIVIDPIYKVLTGDENSAEQMALFCNQFDRICKELHAATIYCHHHSKGDQGQKKSRDRSSGSGVFSRDPDAILDLIELGIDDDLRKVIINRWECDAMADALSAIWPEWDQECSQDAAIVADRLWEFAVENGHEDAVRSVRPEARRQAQMTSGWRIEGTVREFAPFPPKNFFYRYPIHVPDPYNLLANAKAEGEELPWERKKKGKEQSSKERKAEQMLALENAFEICIGFEETGEIHRDEIGEHMGLSARQIERRVKDHPKFTIENRMVKPITTEGNDNE